MRLSRFSFFVLTAGLAGLLSTAAFADPVAIYNFTSVKDGALADASGKGNDANLDGEVNITDGKNGKGLQFNGDDTMISLPPEVMGGEEVTVALWVNSKRWKDWERIFDFGSGPNGDAWLGYSGISKKLRLDWFTKSAAVKIIEAPIPAVNKWTHIAVTANAKTICVYVDGKLAGSTDSLGIIPSQIPAAGLFIGKSNWAPDPLFKGKMSDIYIDDKALTAEQIKDVMEGKYKK